MRIGPRLELHGVADLAVNGLDDELDRGLQPARSQRKSAREKDRGDDENGHRPQVAATVEVIGTGPRWKRTVVASGDFMMPRLRPPE